MTRNSQMHNQYFEEYKTYIITHHIGLYGVAVKDFYQALTSAGTYLYLWRLNQLRSAPENFKKLIIDFDNTVRARHQRNYNEEKELKKLFKHYYKHKEAPSLEDYMLNFNQYAIEVYHKLASISDLPKPSVSVNYLMLLKDIYLLPKGLTFDDYESMFNLRTVKPLVLNLLTQLPEKSSLILNMIYGLGEFKDSKSCAEVGRLLSLSRARISKLRLSSLEALRHIEISEHVELI